MTDPVSHFDGKTISYTYDNGWSFTNTFDGHLRISHVPRGELREHVEMTQLRDRLYFVSWIDDEMGLISQIIDLESGTVLAAIPVDGEPRTQILTGTLTDRGDQEPTAAAPEHRIPAVGGRMGGETIEGNKQNVVDFYDLMFKNNNGMF